MTKIQLFIQYEGSPRIELVTLDADALAKEVVLAAKRHGLSDECAETALVFSADGDEPLQLDVSLSKQRVRDKHRIHIHRCTKIDVTLHFNELIESMHFPPSATVDRVKRRFVQKIGMTPVDATEHVLQICGTTERPEPDMQIGALTNKCCSLCFNLVPIKRIEG